MTTRHNAILRRSRQGAVAARGVFTAQASSACMASKRLPSHQRAASYLHGHDLMASHMDSGTSTGQQISQPQWLGNGFEDIAPSPGGGCSAGQ